MPKGGGLAGTVEAAGALAGLIPGGQAVAAAAAPLAMLMRGLGISRLSKEALAAAGAKKRKKGRGRARRQAKRGQKAGLYKVPPTTMANRQMVGNSVAASVPSTYQRQLAIPDVKDGVRLEACEGISFDATTTGAASFVGGSTALTPTNNFLFPWLSAEGAYWTKYLFRKLRLYFVSSQATTTGGTAWMLYNPDAEVDSVSNFAAVMAAAQKQITAIWQAAALDVDLKQEGQEPYYLDPDGGDNRLEQQGMIFFGVNLPANQAASTTVSYGQLFVEYVVDLYDRKATGLTLLASSLQGALLNRALPRELRIKAGMAFVDEIIKTRPSKTEKERPEVALRRKVEALLPPPAGSAAALQSTATGF